MWVLNYYYYYELLCWDSLTIRTNKTMHPNQSCKKTPVILSFFRECSLFCFPVQTLETRVTCSLCHLAPLTLWCIMNQILIQDIWVSILHKYCLCFYLQCFNLYLCPTDSLTLEMDVASPMWSEKDHHSSLGLRGIRWIDLWVLCIVK